MGSKVCLQQHKPQTVPSKKMKTRHYDFSQKAAHFQGNFIVRNKLYIKICNYKIINYKIFSLHFKVKNIPLISSFLCSTSLIHGLFIQTSYKHGM